MQAQLGRTFLATDEQHDAEAVLVLGDRYWREEFDADPTIIGQVFEMNDRPHRVVGLTLSGDGLQVTASRVLARGLEQFDEPTLGVVQGDTFYFVANSHWNRFDREGNLPADLTGPVVMKVSLLP